MEFVVASWFALHITGPGDQAVSKMSIPKVWQAPFLVLGNALIIPVCLAFAACPAYMYYLHGVGEAPSVPEL